MPEPASDTRIATRLVSLLSERARGVMVADVRIGLGYTAVMLGDGRAGVAYTFRDLAKGCCSVFHGIRPLAGRPALELLALLESADAVETAVGLACANALGNVADPGHLEGDVLERLELRSDDDVAMVGSFGPLIDAIARAARSLTIFERVSAPTGRLRPQHEAATALPRCQVALITSTAIVNHTIDGLLEAARSCRLVALVGASTPLLAEAFRATKVTMLSGVVVTASDGVLRAVSEGGGTPQLGPHVRKVTALLGSPGSQLADTRGEHAKPPVAADPEQ